MRYRLDDSATSSSAASTADDQGESSFSTPFRSPSTTNFAFDASATPTPRSKGNVRRPMLSSSPSSASVLEEQKMSPEKNVTHLQRATQARALSLSAKVKWSDTRSSPAWMRSSSISIASIDSGDDSASDGGHSDNELSDSDSEEEEWPVAPRRVGRLRHEEAMRARQALMEAKEVAQRIRLSSQDDITSLPDYKPMIARRIRSRAFTPSSGRLQSPEAQAESDRARADFELVQSLQHSLRIQREEDEAKERKIFEARNKALWDSIETGIREAEEKRDRAARDEQERLRRQREAAEKRAKEMKEIEEDKIRKEREAEEEKKRKEEEKRTAETRAEEEKRQEREREEKAKSAGGVGPSLDREAKIAFESCWAKMDHIKTNVLPVVSKNPEWRKQCFTAKRSITRGVSQLTNSRSEIIRITQSIGDVLTQARAAVATGEIYAWILNHLSKCLIRQAEQEVAAKQDTAFPLARVVVWLLLSGHAELGDALMARLTKKCCWCLPYCPGRKEGQNDAAYAKLLGKANLDEATFAYTTRMTGIIAFYFAICQTTPTLPPGSSSASMDVKLIPDYFRVKALWTWQARAMSPRILDQSIAPALWSALIEVSGPVLVSTYRKQTVKLWKLMLQEGLEQGKAGFCTMQAANSAKTRLKELLQDFGKTGRVQGATGGREMEA